LAHSTSATVELATRLERCFAVERAILVGRAARGLLAVLRVWRVNGPKCRVAISGAICHEVLLAILTAGCEPVFCDVDVADGLVPDSEWTRARALGADVAIVAHLYGNPAQIAGVRSAFPAPDCLVIDDAAQALGSRTKEGLCGSSGDIGLLSFGRTKQISIGNGATLVRDLELAAKIEADLSTSAARHGQSRSDLQHEFRIRLDLAREQLIATDVPDASGFAGLLDGADWMLDVPFDPALSEGIVAAIEHYEKDALARTAKARTWQEHLEGTGLVPVGMGRGCVPWRYVCRLPGIDWSFQTLIAETIRKRGIHVSTWYLPAHWFVGQGVGTLPGVERLSREVFQFWLDGAATQESIAAAARVIRRELAQFATPGGNS
jgi:hypothetical protein